MHTCMHYLVRYIHVLLLQGQVLLLRSAELRRLGQVGLLLGRDQLGQVVLLTLQRADLPRGRLLTYCCCFHFLVYPTLPYPNLVQQLLDLLLQLRGHDLARLQLLFQAGALGGTLWTTTYIHYQLNHSSST